MITQHILKKFLIWNLPQEPLNFFLAKIWTWLQLHESTSLIFFFEYFLRICKADEMVRKSALELIRMCQR